jgi:hypothetical protein
MSSLTGRSVAPQTPVGELDVVVESQEYDECVKSIRYKAVERRKQANKVLRASPPGELRREFTNPRENQRIIALL